MIRYQIYSLDKKGNLQKPITTPFETEHTARKYFTDCCDVALVIIDDFGVVTQILDIRKEPFIDKKEKQKYKNKR